MSDAVGLAVRARVEQLATWLRLTEAERRVFSRTPEVALFAAALAISLAVRLFKLESVPRVIAGDELDNIRSAYGVIEGTGPGIFGLDWKGTPILGLYPLAASIRVFGDSVADFRMYSVLFSLLTIALFYLLLRETVDAPAALAAALLLGTNLWFLHFSRTAWDNIVPSASAVGACWTATRALRQGRRWWLWWAACGLFLASGLYTYYSGRLIPLAIPVVGILAVVLRQAPWPRVACGVVIAAVVAGLVFAPSLPATLNHWHEYSQRTGDVSVFRHAGFFDRAPWEAVRNNLGRNYRGFILQDGSEMARSLWARYGPANRAPLEIVGTHMFWAGLVISAFRWRRTYTWWPFFIPLLGTQLFSRGTPDLARAVFFAPFYFLFMSMTFDEALRHVSGSIGRGMMLAAIGALVAFVAISDIRGYFDWQGKEATQQARMAGIDRCEFDVWRDMAREAVRDSTPLVPFEQLERSPSCSPNAQ